MPNRGLNKSFSPIRVAKHPVEAHTGSSGGRATSIPSEFWTKEVEFLELQLFDPIIEALAPSQVAIRTPSSFIEVAGIIEVLCKEPREII